MKKIVALSFILIVLEACNKGEGGGSITPPLPKPTLTITATPDTAWYGETAMIHWSSTNATSVTLPSGGVTTTSGSLATSILIAPASYTFTASGSGGSTTSSKTVNVYSQKMTWWCHYGSFTGYLFRICREDSISFPSAWYDKPALIDHNVIQFYPNGSYSINGSSISNPGIWSFRQNETVFFDGLQQWTLDTLNAAKWVGHKVEPDPNNADISWRTVIGYTH